MIETEIKVLIKDINAAIAKLKKLGCQLSKAKSQVDYVYIEKSLSFIDIKPGINILRIRVENKRVNIFTLKQQISNELDRREFELKISDCNQMKQILGLMNYDEIIVVKKKRIETSYNGCSIVIDDVENLGYFMEVEKKVNNENNGVIIQNQLFSFFQSLEIPYYERVFQGYDTLMFNYIKNSQKPL